ncbi:MAG: efflux RND transporter periplasmic adaptor subunit [Gammaproteobacteria bacterium]
MLIIVAIILIWWFFRPRAVAVETFMVPAPAAATAGTTLSASGYVVARERATVSSKVTGMVRKVLVNEGEHIKQGQLVAVLDDSSEQTTIQQMQATLAVDKARIGQAQATLTQARLTLKRNRELVKQHMVSEADLDQAVANAKSDEAGLKAAESQVAVDRALLDSAQLQQKYTHITAPFDGVVTKVYAQPGEMISPGAVGGFTQTGICDLVNMKSLEVHVDINENYLTRLKVGMPATVNLSAYPGQRFDAHVQEIVPVVNKAQATVEVHLGFDKLDPHILPGMQAQVFFDSKDAQNPATTTSAAPIQIPAKAVHRGAKGNFVYLVENGRLRRKPVRVRKMPSGKDTVLSGLSGGEHIVTKANAPLRAGMAVRISGSAG